MNVLETHARLKGATRARAVALIATVAVIPICATLMLGPHRLGQAAGTLMRYGAATQADTALTTVERRPCCSSGRSPAMYQAIRKEAAEETDGQVQVDRVDYVGHHDNGAGSDGYIFYVYFHDASGMQYERFVRVLHAADGSLHVLAP